MAPTGAASTVDHPALGEAPLGDDERLYAAVQARDTRFDGWFVMAVTSTGIYCRPSCPATTPRRRNVRFFRTAAAAQSGGFRACKRCRPDAAPGSPEWRVRSDVVARAMRMIGDGVVDRDGVRGLASRLGYSERHLTRIMTSELGAGPLAIARAQRAHTARVLVETTDLRLTDVAFAAGFSSIRQFNDTVREVFACTPSDLRRDRRTGLRHARPGGAVDRSVAGGLTLRLPARLPFDGAAVLAFVGARAVPGVEHWDGVTYSRSLTLPHGDAVVALVAAADHVRADVAVADWRDIAPAVDRCRRLLDLDADPVAVDTELGADPHLGRLVAARPGLRSPGTVDGEEIAVRAVLGQQVSVAGARTIAGRLCSTIARPLDARLVTERSPIARTFPTCAAIAEHGPADLPMPRRRAAALVGLCSAIVDGRVDLEVGADRDRMAAALVALDGIGPWTASYIGMRLGDPDAFLPGDLVVRRALGDVTPVAAATLAERWRPWRSYATHHLWASTGPAHRTSSPRPEGGTS